MMKNKINVVVNCTPDIPFITDITGAQTDDFLTLPSICNIRVPVYDSHLEKDFLLMEQYLKLVIPILINSFLKEENILVHCFAGKQRSGIVIASLLYSLASHPDSSSLILQYIPKLSQCQSNKEKANCIFDYIVSKRPQTFNYGFRANFIKSFNRLYGIK
jgi:protein-tyrosine phosphatase